MLYKVMNLKFLYFVIEDFILTMTMPGAKDGEEQ